MADSQAVDVWRPAVLTAIVTVVVSFGLSLTLFVVATGASGSPLGWLRGAGRSWLVAMGSTIVVDESAYTLVPVGGVLALIAIASAASWLIVRSRVVDSGAFAAISGGIAGVLAGIVSAATSTGGIETSLFRSVFGSFIVVGTGSYLGAATRRGASGKPAWVSRFDWFATVLRTAFVMLGLLVASGFVIVHLLLLEFHQDAANAWATLNPGVGGGLVLGVLSLLALPTLVVWMVSAMLGPGFGAGGGAMVDLGYVEVTGLPLFPPLAAIPEAGPQPGWAVALAVVPVLVAMGGGWRCGDQRGAVVSLISGATAGALAGLGFAVLVLLSRGSLGTDLLSTVGPAPVVTSAVAVATLSVGGAIGAALSHYRGVRAEPVE